MGEFAASIQRDVDTDVTIINASGDFGMPEAARLWALLGKCVAECPVGIVVDLRLVTVLEPLALTVFTAARRAARRDLPDVPVFVWLAPEQSSGRAARTTVGAQTQVVTSLSEALDRVEESRRLMRRFTAELPMSLNAPAEARALVLEACEFFALDHVAAPAQLVVSELVSNAVTHARSVSDLEIQLRARFLHLRVRDRSPALPVHPGADVAAATAPGGRGLWLVARHSSGWGWRSAPGGKIVWATIRLVPSPAGYAGAARRLAGRGPGYFDLPWTTTA